MAQVSDLVELQELQTAIARSVFEGLRGEDWASAFRLFVEAGDLRYGTGRFTRPDGTVGSVSGPRGLMDLWSRLRAAMDDGASGAWLSAEVHLTRDGRFTFEFNWDRRPYMDSRGAIFEPEDRSVGPTDAQWADDLRQHPRSADRTPPWLAAAAGATVRRGIAPELQVAAATRRVAPLLEVPAWAEVFASVLRHAAALVRSTDYEWLPEEEMEYLRDPEVERFLQDVTRVVVEEQLTQGALGRIADLATAAAGAGLGPTIAGLDSVDRTVPATEHRGGPADRAWAAVVDIVDELTRSLVDAG